MPHPQAGGARAAVVALRSQPNVWEAACGALHCLAASSNRGREAVLQASAVAAIQEVLESTKLGNRGTATGRTRAALAE